ncbi:MAG: hypothetical protein Q9209_005307 [Squamulea sp. 1 TL-2023]
MDAVLDRPRLDSDEAFAYFFYSRNSNDMALRDPKAVLLSVVQQLAAPLPGLPLKAPIAAVYQREVARGRAGAQLTMDEIMELLTDLIQDNYKRVTLVADPLDECDVSTRALVLVTISILTYNPNSVVKTLVLNRNEPDIMSYFSRTPNFSITAADNVDDILSFVSKQIDQRSLQGSACNELKERVCNDLNQIASGSIRWVALQVDSLCDPERINSEINVKDLLSKLLKASKIRIQESLKHLIM